MAVNLGSLSVRQKDDFLRQLFKVSSNMGGEVGFTRSAAGGSPVSPPSALLAQANKQFDAVFAGPNGLKRTAFAMQVPLKNRLDYVAIGRNRVLLVDEIPQGEFPIYDLDIPEFGAVTIAARGTAPLFQVNIKRIQFPTFPISVDEELKWEDIQIRRYPAFDRAKERAAIAMAIGEDDEIFAAVQAAATLVNPAIVAASLTRFVLADAFKTIFANQLIPATVLMNPFQYGDVLKWNSTDVDQVTVNTIVETGLIGSIMGARFLVSTRVPQGKVFVLTTPDKFGRLPERKAVEVKIFDNIPKQQYDIVGWEQIGVGTFNNSGIVEIDII